MKNRVIFHVGGCTGSSNPQAVRMVSQSQGSTEIITRPLTRDEFGANTTSLALVIGNLGVLIDNGTGVHQTAEFLIAKQVTEVVMLQTHYHLDHVTGLPTNALLFGKRVRGIYGPELNGRIFSEVMAQFFDPAIWPISPKTFKIEHSHVPFRPGDSLPILGGVRTLALNHPGGCVAYRIPTPVGDVVIATDNELSSLEGCRELAEFVNGAHLLYADIQYREEEYTGVQGIGTRDTKASRRNWGHSTPRMIASMLGICTVPPKIVIGGHHDPKRSDSDLGALEAVTKVSLAGINTAFSFARECREMTLSPGEFDTEEKRQLAALI